MRERVLSPSLCAPYPNSLPVCSYKRTWLLENNHPATTPTPSRRAPVSISSAARTTMPIQAGTQSYLADVAHAQPIPGELFTQIPPTAIMVRHIQAKPTIDITHRVPVLGPHPKALVGRGLHATRIPGAPSRDRKPDELLCSRNTNARIPEPSCANRYLHSLPRLRCGTHPRKTKPRPSLAR